MKIKLPNGVVIDDASEELVRSILGASFSPVETIAEERTPAQVPVPVPAAETPSAPKKKMHPFNRNAVPSPDFDPLPAACKTIVGRHHIVKKEMFLVLRELNTSGRALAPKEIRKRLQRYEVFSTLKGAAIYHALYMLIHYGAIIRKEDSTYIIAPEVIGADDTLLVELINSHDSEDEWTRLKH